ncbi:hypothetical protein PoB_003021900 [Plakobranchus ocellatus]|uniref:Uncharacterized protein n=1 Tax=Plakobranchus ocellatus TaxID=259542 RepID=A0AAV4AB85_9GAST|nr:hypothetical protein PoB_003021900 [Plakobranchus ocellatus]
MRVTENVHNHGRAQHTSNNTHFIMKSLPLFLSFPCTIDLPFLLLAHSFLHLIASSSRHFHCHHHRPIPRPTTREPQSCLNLFVCMFTLKLTSLGGLPSLDFQSKPADCDTDAGVDRGHRGVDGHARDSNPLGSFRLLW